MNINATAMHETAPAASGPKLMSLVHAISITRTMRADMEETCPDTAQVRCYLAAVDKLVDYVTTPSDRWVANIYLLVLGALLLALGVVCGAAGCWHAFHGHPEAQTIGLYAAGFLAFGLMSLLGVRK